MKKQEIIYQDDFISIIKDEYNIDLGLTRQDSSSFGGQSKVIVSKGMIRYWLCNTSGGIIYSHQKETKWGYKSILEPSEGIMRAEFCEGEWFYFDLFGNLLKSFSFKSASDFHNGFAIVSASGFGHCLMDHSGKLYVKDSCNTLIKLPQECHGGEMISDDHIAIYKDRFLYIHDKHMHPITITGWNGPIYIKFLSYEKGPTAWSIFLKDCYCFPNPAAKTQKCIFNLCNNTICFMEDIASESKNNYSYNSIGEYCILITNKIDYIEEDYDEDTRRVSKKNICYTKETLVFTNGFSHSGVMRIEVLANIRMILIHGSDYQNCDKSCGCISFDGINIAPIIYSSICIDKDKFALTYDGDSYMMTMSGQLLHNELLLPKGVVFYKENGYGTVVVASLCTEPAYSKKYVYGIFCSDDLTELLPINYSSVLYCDKNTIIVCQNDKYGILDGDMNTIIPISYNSIKHCHDNLFICSNDERHYGIINREGEVILPFKFTEVTLQEDNMFLIKNDFCWSSGQRSVIADRYLNTIVSDGETQVTLNGFYENEGNFHEGVCIIITDTGKRNLINYKSELLSYMDYDKIEHSGIENLFIASKGDINYLLNVKPFFETPLICQKVWCSNDFKAYGYLFFSDGLSIGIISYLGETILDCIYSDITLSGDVINIQIGQNKGVSDINGNILIPCKYKTVRKLDNGYFLAYSKYALLYSPHGKEIISERELYSSIIESDGNCLKTVVVNNEKERKYGIISLQGKKRHDPDLSYIGKFINGEAIFNYGGCNKPISSHELNKLSLSGGKYGVINEIGRIIIKPIYSFISNSQEGYRSVCLMSNDNSFSFGLIKDSGIIAIKCKYSYTRRVIDDLVVYANGGHWSDNGRKTEKLVTNKDIPSFLSEAEWGIMDTDENIIINPFADYISPISEGMATFRSGDKYGIINITSNSIQMTEFNYLSVFKEGMCVVGIFNKLGNMKYGYINLKIELVLPCEYDEAYSFNNGMATVICGHTEYMINIEGDIISSYSEDNNYDDDVDWEHETWNALTDGQYGDYPGSGVDYDFLGY